MAIRKDTSPVIITFYGESAEDLAKMPTATKAGEGKYDYGLAPKGSIARILTDDGLKTYMLRTTGWVDISDSQITEVLL